MGASTTEKLLAAKASATLVRFQRRFEDSTICGYVVEVGPKFFLLKLVSDRIQYDGFECFRVKDVRRVKPEPRTAFFEAVLAVRFPEGVQNPAIDLSSIETLLRSAAAEFPLITLHCERETPDACWIGKLIEIGKKKVSIRSVTPDATWEDEIDRYALKSITRVSFGGDYETALHLVAGDAPSTSAPEDQAGT